MSWKHIEPGEPIDLHVDDDAHVFHGEVFYPDEELLAGPALALDIVARDREEAHAKAVKKIGELEVAATGPPVIVIYDVDELPDVP